MKCTFFSSAAANLPHWKNSERLLLTHKTKKLGSKVDNRVDCHSINSTFPFHKTSLSTFFSFFLIPACNRTYYGDIGKTYDLELPKPRPDRLPFLCHLTFTANGHHHGDFIQVKWFIECHSLLKTYYFLIVWLMISYPLSFSKRRRVWCQRLEIWIYCTKLRG